ncbi:MAG: ribosome maturation factor RimM [Castellaniella sp.]|uniref:ribosome maturation factor RimM n=1 Tax=Castellaniella sp. TaxID=1955812 RepID=UPI002A364130|nr:ribosome maturation factor RimM [Castellaniella sp.]MDY0309525.1 ribosome maturation factor RimM [Castellaniella sp.]
MADSAFLDAVPPNDLVEVGRVVNAHGVRGWLKILPHSPQADALAGASVWWFKAPDPMLGSGALARPRALKIRACRRQGGQFLAVQADGISDRNMAETLRGHTVWVSRASFPAAAEDEYYWVDLIGCDVHGLGDDGPRLLGRVDQVLDNGAHAILQVMLGAPDADGVFQPLTDARGRPRHALVPFVAAHVQSVDLQARRIDSDWPADF